MTVVISAPITTTATTATRHERILAYDVLRVLAALAVVYIHESAPVLVRAAWLARPGWQLALFLSAASRVCVPMFVMLAGAFALDYRRRMTTQQFFRKRVTRVVVPFVVWTVIYLVYATQTGVYRITSLDDVLAHTLYAPAFYHLWFFYMFLGLYLVTPILAVLVSAASRPTLWAFVVLCFVAPSLSLYAYFTKHVFYAAGYIPQLGYVGYYVLGYLLKDVRPGVWLRAVLYLAAACAVAAETLISYQLSLANGMLNNRILDYPIPLQAIIAGALWIAVQQVQWERVLRWRWLRAGLTLLALSTFGIYLLHAIVLIALSKQSTVMQALPLGSMRYVVLAAPLTFVVTAVIILALRAIPGVSRLVAWLIP